MVSWTSQARFSVLCVVYVGPKWKRHLSTCCCQCRETAPKMRVDSLRLVMHIYSDLHTAGIEMQHDMDATKPDDPLFCFIYSSFSGQNMTLELFKSKINLCRERMMDNILFSFC